MSPEEDPDVGLMLAVKADDYEAFELLFRKYARQIAGYARAIVRSDARAEELAQTTFLQVFKNRHTYLPTARFRTWIFRIATNLCLSELRRPERRIRFERGATPEDEWAIDEIPNPDEKSAERVMIAAERITLMRNLLESLPAQQRIAIVLARSEGMAYDEIGETLGLSLSAVKSVIHRATVRLRRELAATSTEK